MYEYRKVCEAGSIFRPDPAQFGLDRVEPTLDWDTPCTETATHVLCLDFKTVVVLCCPHLHTINEALNVLDAERATLEEQKRTAAQSN